MIMACVARIRRNEADGAVLVFTVVPTREALDPSLSISLGSEALGRPIWAVFTGSEQGF